MISRVGRLSAARVGLATSGGFNGVRIPSLLASRYSTSQASPAGPGMDPYERQIFDTLSKELDPKTLTVNDVSGGCGSMFAINIVSDKFKGLTMIKQHRLVNTILAEEISKWHGLQLRTSAPKSDA